MSARALVLRWLGRTALLLAWSLVVWGALLDLVTLLAVASEGPGPALARVVPPPDASLWVWANLASMVLAPAVGLAGAGLWHLRDRGSDDS
jgi:hypothetical protein